ncbi:DUF2798 domain-containing protein [Oricola sp.]|uniref:DUF2798 domain-containing protein n=1 Tax=Oricola sp. TaxID=1979950 RepID=UPI0025CF97E8|nr:DUF2798 domain-containing protein [Oricola sp.]MCI5077488.1 DUF2798 domain-containing protein [Oricola sp.]
MTPFIPKRLEFIAFGLLLSGLMSGIVSGVATALALGLVPDFAFLWFKAWLSSWALAFPSVLVVAPIVRNILGRIVKPD